jgi:lipopolysaccharide heptosyltransferase II
MTTAAQRWELARNVLAVRLDALGDVLMTTPALRALKEGCPGRRLTLLTSPGAAAAAPLLDAVDDVWAYDAPWVKATAPRADSRPELAMVERLRSGRFDAAVVFTVYSQNPLPAALLCLLADVPLRLAYCRENPYQLLTDWVHDPEPERTVRHEVRRQLDLVAHVGCRGVDGRMSLRVPEAARRRARALLSEIGVDGRRPWVLIHPGASAASRRYPPEGFAAAAGALVREHGCAAVFTGSVAERELVDGIRDMMDAPSASLAGELDLAELAAAVELAPVLISNNTGPVHVAAAVGTPVVDLYALTNPQHAPWMVPSRVLFHDVPCRYCYKSVCPEGHHDCLRLVRPEAVVRAACELFAAGRGAPATPSTLPPPRPRGRAALPLPT